ncbi:hypothetical protein GH714_033085 [Hevea brasiliensis]|uniref:Aconitase A/isopropylmalate dehydratase small subunit swivel domain-containing protein n=1 Tax=Hevea brasiliensis TaxID=3981 RepID=A0A6A6KAD5_HEVBR|nr:hypothetical protein GH714_033085 [Hevea brasiliensis]
MRQRGTRLLDMTPLFWLELIMEVEAPEIGLPRGVKAAIAKSFERIHRSNLVGMGIIPLCFKPGQDADTLGLSGHERYTIDLPSNISDIRPGQDVTVTTDNGKSFNCTVRFDTEASPLFLYPCNSSKEYEFVWQSLWVNDI